MPAFGEFRGRELVLRNGMVVFAQAAQQHRRLHVLAATAIEAQRFVEGARRLILACRRQRVAYLR